MKTHNPTESQMPGMTVRLTISNWAIVVAGFLLLPTAVSAQSVGRVETTTSTVQGYYQYFETGAPTVLVHVLGAVNAPGMYEVTDGTTMSQLLALSGGPMMGPLNTRNSRKVEVRVMRSASIEPVYMAKLDEAIGNRPDHPRLVDGDVLVVDVMERQKFNWRDAVSLASAAAIIILALDRLGE